MIWIKILNKHEQPNQQNHNGISRSVIKRRLLSQTPIGPPGLFLILVPSPIEHDAGAASGLDCCAEN